MYCMNVTKLIFISRDDKQKSSHVTVARTLHYRRQPTDRLIRAYLRLPLATSTFKRYDFFSSTGAEPPVVGKPMKILK